MGPKRITHWFKGPHSYTLERHLEGPLRNYESFGELLKTHGLSPQKSVYNNTQNIHTHTVYIPFQKVIGRLKPIHELQGRVPRL